MTVEEILENFKKQYAELEKLIREGEEQLSIMNKQLLKISGAIEGINLVLENTNSSTEEVKSDEKGKGKVLSK